MTPAPLSPLGYTAAAARWALATGPGRKIAAAWAALVTALLMGTGFLALNILSHFGVTRLLWSATCASFWRSQKLKAARSNQ